ncbi:hypothetical protein P4H66_08825 [Paenibacillus dokdonensis]|uniref:DUF4025 domain-containing protein n=1 Tax=Paenibacillus dokdonensis TaxID=2567944 RepID=A0ABU6GL50_9BACL|nr:hypothetical protein [Paenibacillus dokdonensis]MEC0239948.1 hypothetical protein [Paenibacillus dokdonensis]
MEKNKQKEIEADRLNFHDETADVVGREPATTNVDDAVAAMTSHINKYDVPDELEEK